MDSLNTLAKTIPLMIGGREGHKAVFHKDALVAAMNTILAYDGSDLCATGGRPGRKMDENKEGFLESSNALEVGADTTIAPCLTSHPVAKPCPQGRLAEHALEEPVLPTSESVRGELDEAKVRTYVGWLIGELF